MSNAQMTQVKAVLFDLDGTLLDTAPDMGAALNAVLREEGRPPVGPEVAKSFSSHGSRGLLEYAYAAEFHARREELRDKFLRYYAANIAADTQLYSGISELLAQLSANGIATAIVTNKPQAMTEQLIPYFPELAALPVRVSGDTLAVAKPHPDPILYAAEQLAIDPVHCWYVGDAERDIQAGRAAGMKTVLARYGYIAANEQPEQWGADYSIEHPLQLLELLS
ncbi:phosphoglycolate phosphatase [Pseudidiomarina salilacus]|uniref:phosphoglycolate phosphatase n=1 Tax=Pseudidiomarina salilacus TaxID=3384452 RepID=UPI003984ADC9